MRISATTTKALAVCGEVARVISDVSTRLIEAQGSKGATKEGEDLYTISVVAAGVVHELPSPRSVRAAKAKRVRWAARLEIHESQKSAWSRGTACQVQSCLKRRTDVVGHDVMLVRAKSELLDLRFEYEERCESLRAELEKQTSLRQTAELENAILRRELAAHPYSLQSAHASIDLQDFDLHDLDLQDLHDDGDPHCSVCYSTSDLRRWACCKDTRVCKTCISDLLDDGAITCQGCFTEYPEADRATLDNA